MQEYILSIYSIINLINDEFIKIKEVNLTRRRSFASFLWSLMWKEKKFRKTKKGMMNIP